MPATVYFVTRSWVQSEMLKLCDWLTNTADRIHRLSEDQMWLSHGKAVGEAEQISKVMFELSYNDELRDLDGTLAGMLSDLEKEKRTAMKECLWHNADEIDMRISVVKSVIDDLPELVYAIDDPNA